MNGQKSSSERPQGGKEKGNMTEAQCAALANLEMIYLIAKGQHSPKPDELERRKGALTAFIVSGECFATDSYRQLAAKVNEAVTAHLNQQSGAMKPECVAALAEQKEGN